MLWSTSSSQLTQDGASTFGYDATGNRTNAGYATGTGNRTSTDGVWTYTYDAEGNVTKKSKGTSSDTWVYTYDHNDQMLTAAYSATDGGSVTQRATYAYDAYGNRVQRQGWNGTTSTTERYGLDGWDPAKAGALANERFDTWADLDGSNALTMRRTYGPGFDEVVARQTSGGTVNWYLTDLQGSVRQVIDNSATPQATTTYSAFGQVTSGTLSDRFAYTGQEQDALTGLLSTGNGMRELGTDTGRFYQEDPIWPSSGVNPFTYVSNSPTNATDPSGLQVQMAPPVSIIEGDAPISNGGLAEPPSSFWNPLGNALNWVDDRWTNNQVGDRIGGGFQAVTGGIMVVGGGALATGSGILGIPAPPALIGVPIGIGISLAGLDQVITGIQNAVDRRPDGTNHTSWVGEQIDSSFGGGGQSYDLAINLAVNLPVMGIGAWRVWKWWRTKPPLPNPTVPAKPPVTGTVPVTPPKPAAIPEPTQPAVSAPGNVVTPGTKLGSGGNKNVFVVQGDETKAVGVLKPGKPATALDEEIALIKQLEAQGLPTVKIHGVVEVEGRPAIVMDRYAQGSKDVVRLQDGKVRFVGDSPLLNERSVADLQKIKDTMIKNNVKIDDLQFLIGPDGRVVVADPLKVVVGQAPSKNNLRMIDLLIDVAKKK